ncbi:pyridoxamine 5'-phosphate oxidase family protein [Micromonospora rosaria]|uniref:pyridoxamine 5'-phosphate oxidase family protein n=1 Tax=Micromonospora rosaria TaxID=47874 RepID=UPI00082A3744|nr:pyridoxamine 5'-phosphate oxidase family protein [Micromonospora rosaria]
MSRGPTAAAEARRRVTDLVRQSGVGMLTTIDLDGRLVSRPMGLPQEEFDGDLWFFAYAGSATLRHIRVNPEVNVAFADRRHAFWVSLTGIAGEGYDRERAERLWRPALAAWFPAGPDTPGLTLIKVHAIAADCWDAASGTVTTLLGRARSGRPGGTGRSGADRAPGTRGARSADEHADYSSQ